MSSNLLKRGATCLKTEEARVIDSNALMAERISMRREKRIVPMPPQEDGFSQGLSAEVLEVLSEEEDVDAVTASEPVYSGPTPEELREMAEAEIQRMQEEAALSLEKERKMVLDEARKQGYEDGHLKALTEVEAAKQELAQEKVKLERQYEIQLEQIEPQMVDTLTDIYEHIFHVDLSGYRELIIYLIAGAMRKTEGGRDIIVHVSKEDYPYVSMQKKQILSGITALNTNVEIIEDITLTKNQALIETGGGIFDCSLGTQLSELNRKIKLLSYEKTVGE